MSKMKEACFCKQSNFRFLLAFGLCLILSLIQGCASTNEEFIAAPGVQKLLEKYPAGTIDTIKIADQVLDAVSRENQVLDDQFRLDMDTCIDRFLVNLCYEEADQRLKQNRALLEALSVEADRFKRSEKIRLRDLALIDSEQKERSKAAERAQSRQDYEEKESRYHQDTQSIPAADEQTHYVDIKVPDEASPPKVEEGAYTISKPSLLKNPDTVLTPEERRQNVQEYEEKQLESARKQEQVEQKKAETQAKRERHAARQATGVKRKQKVAKD